jgi:hypothetical protein
VHHLDELRAPGVVRNRLLAALYADDQQQLATVFRFTSLRVRQILHRQGEPIETIYFPKGRDCRSSAGLYLRRRRGAPRGRGVRVLSGYGLKELILYFLSQQRDGTFLPGTT